jgi:hypothetical protein
MQRAELFSVNNGGFGFTSLTHHSPRFDVDESIQLRIELFDFLQVRFGKFYRGNFAIADFLRHF